MTATASAQAVLDREFLEIRARILELGAALDRLDRAEGSVASDVRRVKIDEALKRLTDGSADRAESVQHIFSIPYEDGWPTRLGVRR